MTWIVVTAIVFYVVVAFFAGVFCWLMAHSNPHSPVPDSSEWRVVRNCALLGLIWPVFVPGLIKELL